jgi:hypothetical protein
MTVEEYCHAVSEKRFQSVHCIAGVLSASSERKKWEEARLLARVTKLCVFCSASLNQVSDKDRGNDVIF